MTQKRERAVPRQRTALTQNTKSLTSFETTDTAPGAHRQAPIGAIRLAQRFGLSVSTAAAVVEANGWGCCS